MENYNNSAEFISGKIVSKKTLDGSSFWERCFPYDTFFIFTIKDTEGNLYECFSSNDADIGDEVTALSCRKVNGTDSAVIIDTALKEIINHNENFIEYLAHRFNHDYIFDRSKNTVFRIESDRDDIEEKLSSEVGNGKFINATIESCRPKDLRSFCKAYFIVDFPSGNANETLHFKFSQFLDYETSLHTEIIIYVYKGRDGLLHFMPIAPCFSDFILSLNEEKRLFIEKFFGSPEFKVIGRLLNESGKNLFIEGNTLKVIVTSTALGTVVGRNHYRSRALSVFQPNYSHYDIDLYVNVNQPVSIGTILDAVIKKNKIGKYIFSHEKKREKKTAELAETPVTEHKTDENISGDDSSSEMYLDNVETLLTVHDGETLIVKSTENSKFNTNNFNAALTNGTLWGIHFDVLDWISTLKFATHNLLFRLMIADILPHDISALTPSQLNSLERMKTSKLVQQTICETDKDGNTFEFQKDRIVRAYFKPINNLIDKLEKLGLVETMRFSMEDLGSNYISKILVITHQGRNLLNALERTPRPFDSFFGVTPPRVIKKRLAANHLLVTYLSVLKEHFPVTIKDVEFTPSLITKNEEEFFRAGFLMTLHNENGDELKIICEAVRNTAGITKSFDELEINEKIPRILRTLNIIAAENKKNFCLSLVTTSFEEMNKISEFVYSSIKEEGESFSDRVHVFLSYDELLTDNELTNTHFELDKTSGNIKRIENLTERFKNLTAES